ncbi:[similarity to] type IV pilus assembly PilZ, partial [methanotrophic bacterial endosymbiont of Bathymodiolus sp.]
MAESSARQGILSLAIKEKHALYTAYMPFVENGGLFIPTNREYYNTPTNSDKKPKKSYSNLVTT